MSREDLKEPEEEREDEEGAEPVDVVTSGGRGGWIPLIAVIVMMPAASFAMMEYLVFPRMESRLAAMVDGGAPASGNASAAKGEAMFTHTFEDVIVNVSGTLGTRYLKTSFTVHSSEPALSDLIAARKSRLMDAALSTLSSLRLQDLEQPAARNFIRNELIDALNAASGRPIVQELYFLDFVVQ